MFTGMHTQLCLLVITSCILQAHNLHSSTHSDALSVVYSHQTVTVQDHWGVFIRVMLFPITPATPKGLKHKESCITNRAGYNVLVGEITLLWRYIRLRWNKKKKTLNSQHHIGTTMQCISSPSSARCCRKNETRTGLLIEAVTLPAFH